MEDKADRGRVTPESPLPPVVVDDTRSPQRERLIVAPVKTPHSWKDVRLSSFRAYRFSFCHPTLFITYSDRLPFPGGPINGEVFNAYHATLRRWSHRTNDRNSGCTSRFRARPQRYRS